MMYEQESKIHQLIRKAIEKTIQHTYSDWPPKTPCGFYQPYRPESPIISSKNEIKSSK